MIEEKKPEKLIVNPLDGDKSFNRRYMRLANVYVETFAEDLWNLCIERLQPAHIALNTNKVLRSLESKLPEKFKDHLRLKQSILGTESGRYIMDRELLLEILKVLESIKPIDRDITTGLKNSLQYVHTKYDSYKKADTARAVAAQEALADAPLVLPKTHAGRLDEIESMESSLALIQSRMREQLQIIKKSAGLAQVEMARVFGLKTGEALNRVFSDERGITRPVANALREAKPSVERLFSQYEYQSRGVNKRQFMSDYDSLISIKEKLTRLRPG